MWTIQLILAWAVRCALVLLFACVASRTIRTAVLSNVISIILSARVMCLPRADRGGTKPIVSRSSDGLICIRDVDIRDLFSEQQIRSACEGLAFEIADLHIESFTFGIPDLFRWRFDLKCHGWTLELRQKAMPETRPLSEDNDYMAGTLREKHRRLAVVDLLLWGTNSSTSESDKAPRRRSPWLAAVLHAAVAVSIRAISLQMSKMALTVFQDTIPGPWQNSKVESGKKHREGLSVAVRSITCGPVLPRRPSASYRSKYPSKVSNIPICDQHWAKRVLPRPLLDALSSRDMVVQASFSVEGLSVYVLSTLPNLLNGSAATASIAPGQAPVAGAAVSSSQHMGQTNHGQQEPAGHEPATPAQGPRRKHSYIDWTVNCAIIQQWGFQVTLSSVPNRASRHPASVRGPGVTAGQPRPQKEHATVPHLARIPESGNHSGRMLLGSQLSQHSSLSRFVPARTPMSRVRGSSFRWTHGSGTPHQKPGVSGSRAFGPPSAMPSFLRTFGTENLDKSTDSIPADVFSEAQDRDAPAQPEQPEPDTGQSSTGYVRLDLKVEFRALMPCADIRSMAVLSRVALRTHLFMAMEAGWASRPSVTVSEDPRAWWRHALQMVLRESRKVRRRRMTLFAASRKRKLRQRYQALYRRLHQDSAHYTDPDRRWWKVWQLWQRRKPTFWVSREELSKLDTELPLDELLHFRLRTAMRHSYLLQSREYASVVIRILNTMSVNAHVPLPHNMEAIIKGEPIAPFLCDPSLPVRFCACVSIPRIGFNVLLERPDQSVLFGALSGCSARLDAAACCSFAIETAEIGIRAGHGTTPTTDNHVRGTHLLHSPCLSFAQLQHSYHPQHSQGGKAGMPTSMHSETFLHGTISACGTHTGEADPGPPFAPFDTAQPPFSVHGGPHGVNASLRGSSHAGEAHSDRDYVPSPSASAASHDVPVIHEDMRWSQRHRQLRATELLKQRIQMLRGDVLVGSVSATVAPLEAFIDSASLVRVLELGMQLCSEVQQGDVYLQRACGCGSTTVAALEAGKLPGLVHTSLVRHRVAIQGPSPPLLPMLSVDCGGVIARIGLDEDPMGASDMPRSANAHALDGKASSYEFVFSVVAFHGSLVPKIDLQHHAAATSAGYHMHASIIAVEAGFMQGGIVPLLQDPDLVSVVRDAHEAANLAWQHPADGDALATELQRGAVFDPDDEERKAYIREAFPHVVVQPCDGRFPVLPLFQIMGCGARSALIIPLASSVAGNAHLTVTALSKGATAAVSPLQIRMLRGLVDTVMASYDSVNDRAAKLTLPVMQHPDASAAEVPRFQARKSADGGSSQPAAMPAGNMHVTLAVHVPVAAGILFAPCSGSTNCLQAAAWVERVLSPSDPWSPKARDAATWASQLSPLVDISVVDMRFGCDVRGAAACAVTATCGGCMVVDLQPGRSRRATAMSPDSLVFGPLPCRAANVAKRAAQARRYMYGLPSSAEAEPLQPSGSHRASRTRDLSGSSSIRRASLERVSLPCTSTTRAHHAAYLWRRLSGELWLQSRCAYLLQAQAALGQAADPTFSTWSQVYDHTMGTSDCSKAMLSVEVAASRSATAMDASASIVLQQLHSTVILKGNENLIKGVSELLYAALDGSSSTPSAPRSEDPGTGGASPTTTAAQAAGASGQSMKLRMSLVAVSSQIRAKAGRKRFLDAVVRDSAVTVTFSHDPSIAPEGELHCDASVADVMIRHGADMLTSADDSGTLLCMPAPYETFAAEHEAPDHEPAWGASSNAALSETPRSRQSHTEAHMHVESDVCLSLNAVHWLNISGSSGSSNPARAQVHLQAVRPLLRFHMRFLYDVLHLVEQLSSLQAKYFHSPTDAEIEGTPAQNFENADTEPPPPLQLDLPVDFQVTVWEGAVVVPEKSGSRRAVAVMADTIVLGMPAAVLKPFDMAPTPGELHAKTDCARLGLPPVRSMLEESARTLARHQVMSEVRHGGEGAASDSGESSSSTSSARPGGMDGVVNSGARVMREWFREKMIQARDAMSSFAHRADSQTASQASVSGQQGVADGPPAEETPAQEAAAGGSEAVIAAEASPGDVPEGDRTPGAGGGQAAGEISHGDGPTVQRQPHGGAVNAAAAPPAPARDVAAGQGAPLSDPRRRLRHSSTPGPAQNDGVPGQRETLTFSLGPRADEAAAGGAPTGGNPAAEPAFEEAGRRPMDTGIDRFSEPMLSFVASSYKVFGCRAVHKKGAMPGSSNSSPANLYVPPEAANRGDARVSMASNCLLTKKGTVTYGDIVPIFSRGNVEFAFAMREDYAVHLHLASSPVWVFLSPASYWSVIDTCCGNFLEGSALDPAPPPIGQNMHRPYRPRVTMWPAAADGLLATVTVASAKAHLLIQGDPRTWEAGLPPRPLLSAPRVPFARIDVNSFALSVLATQRQGLVETFVLGDTQECHTYDLRLARFHLLYEPWAQGPAAVSGMDRQSSSREFQPEQRQMSRTTSNLRAAAFPRAASSQQGADPSSGGDTHESAAPALVYLQDLHEAGVLHTADHGAEYRGRVDEIEQLPPVRRRETLRVPVVHLASSPVDHHAARNDWAAHLPRDHRPEAALEAAFCVQGDMTMAVDVALRHFQAFWPWAAEFGLLDAIMSIFMPDEKAADGQAAPQLQPWMYVNVVLEHAQALVPLTRDLLDVDGALSICKAENEGPLRAGSNTLANLASRITRTNGAIARVSKQVMDRPRMFQLMCQAMLNKLADDGDVTPLHRLQREAENATLLTPFLSGTAPRGGSGPLPRPPQLMLPEDSLASLTQAMVPAKGVVDSALAFTVQAIRYGMFYGDDGKSITLADVWSAAGHAVHRDVCMECWLLPCTLSAELEEETPLVEEQRKLQMLHRAAKCIQRWWRAKKMMMYLRETGMIRPDMARYDSSDSASVVAWGAVSGRLGAAGVVAVPQSASKVVDDLIYRRLNPGDRERVDRLLAQQKSVLDLGLPLGSTKRCLKVRVESCSVRVAVSHLGLHRLLKAQVPVILEALQQPTTASGQPSGRAPASPGSGKAVEVTPFRQSFNCVELQIENEVSAWLCNDGVHSFGAPDVLQGSLSSLQLRAEVDVLRPDAPPTVRARGDLRTSMRFLDIASGDWEWLLCPWQVGGEYLYVTTTDPKSHSTVSTAPAQIMSLQSRQHAVTHFNAASLLTVGDAVAYSTALMKEESDSGGSGSGLPTGSAYAAVLSAGARPARPSMDEQMALSMPLTERMPQRYCIQNHLGANLWYWRPAEGPHATLDKFKLSPGQSHQMRCEPQQERVIFSQQDGLQAKRMQSMIAVLVEGNWLPITNVVVSQVGKFRYAMFSPHQSATVHVVVDVMLVGRTKVISIHSSVWLENSTDLPMRVRLHVPPSLLAITPTVEPAPPSARAVSGALHPSRSPSAGALSRSASRAQGDMLSKRTSQEGEGRRGGRDSDRFRPAESTGTPDVLLRVLRPGQGQYLPLAAVLQGSLSFTAQGHYENQRDVLQLTNDLSALPEQQGYLQCMALPSASAVGGEVQQPQREIDPSRLTHFFLRVSNKMRSHGDLSTLAQYEQVATDSFRPATCGVLATVTLKPPLRLTNALPFPAIFTVLEVWYGEEGVHARPHLAESQEGQRIEFVSSVKNAAVLARDWAVGLPEDPRLRDAIYDKSSPIHSQATSGTRLSGRHIVLHVEKGAGMHLYANLHRTILVYMQIPTLHMGSAVWSVLNWGDADRDRGFKWEALPLSGPSDKSKLPELPHFLHIVPEGVTFQQRRRQVLRRLANKMTCGIVPANKGVERVFEPVPQPVANAAQATLSGLRRLDPTPHVAAAWDTVQHGAQKLMPGGSSESPAFEPPGNGSSSGASSADLPLSDNSSRPDAGTAAEAGPSTRMHAGYTDDGGGEEYRVPGTRYTAPQARLLLSALHAWRYAETAPGQRAPKSLFLGIAHSGRASSMRMQARHSCEVTLYSHYWVASSSCMPLVFNDRANTNTQMSLPDMLDMSSMTAPGCIRDLKSSHPGKNRFMVLPCLLNEQSRVRFCVPERYTPTSRRGPYGRSVNISVIGGQPTITLSGPDLSIDTHDALSPRGDDSPLESQRHVASLASPARTAAGGSQHKRGDPARQATELSLPDTQLGQDPQSMTEDSITFLLPGDGRNMVGQSSADGATPAPSAALTLAAASIPETAHEGPTMSDFEHLLTPQLGDHAGGLRGAQPAGGDAVQGMHEAGAAAGTSSRCDAAGTASGAPAAPVTRPLGNGLPWGHGDGAQRSPALAQPSIFAASIPESSHSSVSNGIDPPVPPLAAPRPAPASPLGLETPASEQSTAVAGGDMAPLLQGMHAAGASEITDAASEVDGGASSIRASTPSVSAALHVPKRSPRSGALVSPGVSVVRPTPASLRGSPFDEDIQEPPGSCFGRSCNGTVFNRRTRVRRQYEMAVEVNSASAQSCFRFTKVVHVRDKYIVENRTGEILELKQKGTPDPGIPFGPMRRSACRLPDGMSAPLFWDDDAAPKSIVVRLAMHSTWEWSGGFELQEREDYFGLRIHRVSAAGVRDGHTVILPVSISVEPSGVVLVSFKSQQNLPPYRIRNACTAVTMSVSQVLGDGYGTVPEQLEPGKEVPFAWDEPMCSHMLKITAAAHNTAAQPGVADDDDPEASTVLDIDKLPTKQVDPLVVKTKGHSPSSGPQDLRSRLEGALAGTVVRTVHIDIFADGPTRVVRFTDSGEGLGLEDGIVAAWRRVRGIEQQLSVANQRFVALRGGGGISRIDLFGSAVPREVMANAPAGPSSSTAALPQPAPDTQRTLSVAASGRLRQRSLGSGAPVTAPVAAVVMMLAGELTVSVVNASGVRGNLLVRLQAEEQQQHTTVQWNSMDPAWNEPFTFAETCAASELRAELWDIWSKNTASKFDQKDSINMQTLLEHSCFLGIAHVPLAETLPQAALQEANNSTGPLLPSDRYRVVRECVLTRRHGGDRVAGTITLAFDWKITATSILLQKYKVLKRVLATRNEILSMLAPRRLTDSDAAVDTAAGGTSPAVDAPRTGPTSWRSPGRDQWTLQVPRRHFDISVSVLEVQNVPARHGIGAAITANDAPLPSVVVSVGKIEHMWTATARGTSATFGTTERRSLPDLPADAKLRIALVDGAERHNSTTCGVVTLALGALDLSTPKYVWIEVDAAESTEPHRRGAAPAAVLRMLSDGAGALKSTFGVASAPPDLGFDPQLRRQGPMLVHMRLAATALKTVAPTVIAGVDLAGMGLLVSSGFDEELMSASFHCLAVSAELAESQAMVSATVQSVQIDDQSLDARQPVVLARANPLTKGLRRVAKEEVPSMTAHGINAQHEPLFQAKIVRSFAHRSEESRLSSDALSPVCADPVAASGQAAGIPPTATSTGTASALSSMMSFKEISVDLAPVDLTAHEAFLTSLFSFAMQLPLDDIWQDEEWQKRNRAAIMSTEVSHDTRLAQQAVAAAQHELHDLHTYEYPTAEEDSVLGSWFFIENFRISDIHSNVTVSISSHIMTTARLLTAQAGQDEAEVRIEDAAEQASNLLGVQFTRLIASSGFQLINVNNVAIELKGKALDSKLLNTNSVVALLVRHYFRQGVKESHKILGGTGPAIAQIPLTFVWAGGTVFDLTLDLASRRAGALSAIPRIGFITLTSASQLIGVASKMAIAFMAVLPYERSGELSDAAAMARYLVRPANAVEAFNMATKAFFQGFLSAFVGLVSDPVAGFRKGNVAGLCVGTVKGTVGLGLRPMAGLAESCSKASQGMALACLGRQGIQGRTARRVYAPGTMRRLQQDHQGDSAEQAEANRKILDMWQRNLASVSHKLRGDKVENVLTVRPRRVLVLTNRHVFYCRARFLDHAHTVRVRWLLNFANVHNILGDEGRFTVLVRATKIVHIPCAGAWRLPLTKKVRTQSLEAFETVAGVLNDQVTDPAHARFRFTRTSRAELHGTQHLPQLRIMAAVAEEDSDGDAGGDGGDGQNDAEIQRA